MKKYTPFELIMLWIGKSFKAVFIIVVLLMLFTDIM